MLGLGLARSCNNESDWLIPGENTYPMIPGDAILWTIPRIAKTAIMVRYDGEGSIKKKKQELYKFICFRSNPLYVYNYDMYSVYFVNLLNKICLN